MAINWSEPGLTISSTIHVMCIVVTLFMLPDQPKIEEIRQTVPIEIFIFHESDLISKGEKSAKEAKPDPKPRADKVAAVTATKPDSAMDKRDVVTPPSRPPSPEPETNPTPPQPPKVAEPAKPEPPKPQPPKPQPKEEVKDEALLKAEKKPEPPKPEPPKPEPPKPEKKPEPPKPEQPKLDPTQLAKLIEQSKPAQPKSEPNTKPFNPNDIKKMLETKEKPAMAASTGAEVNKTASLGAPNATGPKLNPSQKGQFGDAIKDQLSQCWNPPAGVMDGHTLKPVIKFNLQPDGSVIGQPVVMNDQSSPAFRAMAESAMRAIRICSPFKIPAQFAPFHNDWKDTTVIFDPKEIFG